MHVHMFQGSSTRSADSLQEVKPGDLTQLMRLGGKHLYPPTHLNNPIFFFIVFGDSLQSSFSLEYAGLLRLPSCGHNPRRP